MCKDFSLPQAQFPSNSLREITCDPFFDFFFLSSNNNIRNSIWNIHVMRFCIEFTEMSGGLCLYLDMAIHSEKIDNSLEGMWRACPHLFIILPEFM